ncbi:Uracil phosphoribosyltransferase [bacterium HR26]|nr:Uracil phosphoribosyltransferase [bacterium HR26]
MATLEIPTPMRGKPQPSREEVIGHPRLTVLDHPLVTSLLTIVRDQGTPPAEFERCLHELTRFLLWHALQDAELSSFPVASPTGAQADGGRLADGLAALAILRAGLGMIAPLRQLVPAAPIYLVGARRDEQTLVSTIYYKNLPGPLHRLRHVLLLDPMLATGGSAVATVKLLRQTYPGPISFLGIIGAPYGVQQLLQADTGVHIYLAALDERLNDQGFIVPGLGDAGDRLFGTAPAAE